MESATCIAAVAHNGIVWMGGDSAVTHEDGGRKILTNKKVFIRSDEQYNNWIFGFTGAFRFAQLLQFEVKLPDITSINEDYLLKILVTKFIPALHTCLKEHYFEQVEKNRAMGGTCLIGIKGRIFEIGNLYSIHESAKSYNAIGCGGPTALGSLFSTESLEPEKRIQIALAASEEFNWAVGSPFTIIHT
jgi:ATP-dependent protease HslVU (ClpYQ) peptidase subunit